MTTPDDNESFTAARRYMVDHDLRAQGITDERVLAAMARVPRHEFVPLDLRPEAYADRPLPIGAGQTISQPFVVALMSEKLALRGGEKVLEIGTGCGYQTAILAELGCDVVSIEILPALAAAAAERLARLGYRVQVHAADGFFGWPAAAPFDAILLAAAAPQVPDELARQLVTGGRIILPRGGAESQTLIIGTKTITGLALDSLGGVAFVPMTGRVRRDEG